MKFKNLYIELAEKITDLNCEVCDHDFLGYCHQTKSTKGFIVIKSHMSYKNKFFCLAHEAGHLFTLAKSQKFIWSKNPKTEEEANYFALQILNFHEIDPNEYRKFYEKAKKKSGKRKKSWFEI